MRTASKYIIIGIFVILFLIAGILPAYMRYSDIINNINDIAFINNARNQFYANIYSVIYLIVLFLLPFCFHFENERKMAVVLRYQKIISVLIFLCLKALSSHIISLIFMIVAIVIFVIECVVLALHKRKNINIKNNNIRE